MVGQQSGKYYIDPLFKTISGQTQFWPITKTPVRGEAPECWFPQHLCRLRQARGVSASQRPVGHLREWPSEAWLSKVSLVQFHMSLTWFEEEVSIWPELLEIEWQFLMSCFSFCKYASLTSLRHGGRWDSNDRVWKFLKKKIFIPSIIFSLFWLV